MTCEANTTASERSGKRTRVAQLSFATLAFRMVQLVAP